MNKERQAVRRIWREHNISLVAAGSLISLAVYVLTTQWGEIGWIVRVGLLAVLLTSGPFATMMILNPRKLPLPNNLNKSGDHAGEYPNHE